MPLGVEAAPRLALVPEDPVGELRRREFGERKFRGAGELRRHVGGKIPLAERQPRVPETVRTVEAGETVVLEKRDQPVYEKVFIERAVGEVFQNTETVVATFAGPVDGEELRVGVDPHNLPAAHAVAFRAIGCDREVEERREDLQPVLFELGHESAQLECVPLLPLALLVEGAPEVGALQIAERELVLQPGVSVHEFGVEEQQRDELRLDRHPRQILAHAVVRQRVVEADEFDPDPLDGAAAVFGPHATPFFESSFQTPSRPQYITSSPNEPRRYCRVF